MTQNSKPPAIIDQIHELILEDCRIWPKSIAEQLIISRERVGSIIHEDLDMRNLSAKWVLKCLNTDQNFNGASRLSKFWNFIGAIQMISCRARLVTMDETWLYHYDPETKQQSMRWGHRGSPNPKNFRVQKLKGGHFSSDAELIAAAETWLDGQISDFFF